MKRFFSAVWNAIKNKPLPVQPCMVSRKLKKLKSSNKGLKRQLKAQNATLNRVVKELDQLKHVTTSVNLEK